MKRLCSLIIFIFCCVGWKAAFAQTSPLRGMVTDKQTGEPLPGASIDIAAKGKKDIHLLTGLNGSFVVRHIAAGHYEVSVKYVGFDAYKEEMDLAEGTTKTLAVVLEPKRSELATVNVSAGARGTEMASQLA